MTKIIDDINVKYIKIILLKKIIRKIISLYYLCLKKTMRKFIIYVI